MKNSLPKFYGAVKSRTLLGFPAANRPMANAKLFRNLRAGDKLFD